MSASAGAISIESYAKAQDRIDRLTAENKRLREWAREANDLLCQQLETGTGSYSKLKVLVFTYPTEE